MGGASPKVLVAPLLVCLAGLALCAWAGPNDSPAGTPAENFSLASAQKLFLTGKYAEAKEQFSKLQESEPVTACLGLARCHWEVGQQVEALAALSSGLQANPRAGVLLAEQAGMAFGRGDYDTSAQAIAAALKLDPHLLQPVWLAAELDRVHGRLDNARNGYQKLIDVYNVGGLTDPEALHWVGLAAAQFARWNHLSSQFHFLVNDLYPDALAQDANYWLAHYETGLLFLEKYNEGDAAKELKAALAINPQAAQVHTALATLAAQGFELGDAQDSVDRALAINPRLLAAHLVQADIHLANLELDKALRTLEAALPLNPKSDETLGRLAAVYWALDAVSAGESSSAPEKPSRLAKLTAEVTARNPRCGEFYAILAAALDLLRRYPASAENYRAALERMPQLGSARGQWGLILMRLGEEDQAKELLSTAFAADPFNVRVSNMLKVLEVLEGYQSLETPHFTIKFDSRRDKVLAHYVARWLEQVYPQLCRQFNFEPPQRSLFEIFSRSKNTDGHGWFSARMVGLPHIHTIGACAGKIVAMQSPTEKGHAFNWARVLKHEFVHVLNLQQTNFNIPHWYTEALAVLSEDIPRSQTWNDLLVERVAANKLFDLDNINLGFIRAHSGEEWNLAYCQAELYAEYMLAQYGDDALAKMLAAYAENLNTRQALHRAFNVSQEDFERGYRAHLKTLVAGLTATKKRSTRSLLELQKALAENPKNPDLLAEMGLALLNRRQYSEAQAQVDTALELYPKHQLATYVRARLHIALGEDAAALPILREALDEADPQSNLLGLLAGLEMAAQHYDEAARLYELGAKHEPSAPQWNKSLAQLHLKSGNKAKLAEVLGRLAVADVDDATVRKKLAELAHDAGDHAATIRWAREVIEIDVMDLRVHRLLAEALLAQKDPAGAAEEFEVAVLLDPRDTALRLSLAKTHVEANQPAKAREVLEAILEISPDAPEAETMLERLTP